MNKVSGLFSLLCLSLSLGVASSSFAQEQVSTYQCEGAFFGTFSMSPIDLKFLDNKPDLYHSAAVKFMYNGSYGVNKRLKVSKVVSFKNNQDDSRMYGRHAILDVTDVNTQEAHLLRLSWKGKTTAKSIKVRLEKIKSQNVVDEKEAINLGVAYCTKLKVITE